MEGAWWWPNLRERERVCANYDGWSFVFREVRLCVALWQTLFVNLCNHIRIRECKTQVFLYYIFIKKRGLYIIN